MRFLSTRRLQACFRSCGLFAAVVLNSAGWAAEPTGVLTLADAVQAALASNPDLAASAYDIRAAEARVLQSGLRPNPEFTTGIENFAGSGTFRRVDAAETTLSLSQVVELGDKRALRRQVGGADVDLIEVEQQARQLDVLAEVTRRFIVAAAAQERVSLARTTAKLAQKTLDTIVTRVRAARSPEAERSRAQIALTRTRLDVQQAESELQSARQALSASWGTIEPRFTEVRASLFTLEDVEPFTALVERLERSPDFLRFASEARLREAELRLAQAQARPDLTLSAGVRRFQESNEHALVAGFSIPLAIGNRNQGAIREAQVRRDQTGAVRTAAFVRARATLFSLYQELTTARARLETLRKEAVPLAETALAQTRIGYERGRFSYLELASAQQELLSLESAAIEAATDYHQQLTEIERLTAESLAK
jgi:outer membrane protein, heavy metal efflux system